MIKKICLIAVLGMGLAACHTPTKDEKYNKMTPTEIYNQGVKNVKKKNYNDAVEDFQALESRYPFGEFADKSQLGAIYASYLNGEYASAIPAIERFIRMNPRHPHVDYAYYMKGLCHFMESLGFFGKYFPTLRGDRDQTEGVKALETFNLLVNAYPYSPYTADAKQRMLYLRDMIAEHELAAARFYLKKKAYLAAANRGNFIVSHLDQSQAVPEALAIMICAYRALEMNKHAEDAERILAMSFPTSPYTEMLTQG